LNIKRKVVLIKKFSSKRFCPSVKSGCLPAEDVNETPVLDENTTIYVSCQTSLQDVTKKKIRDGQNDPRR